jgi:hypothetical protein
LTSCSEFDFELVVARLAEVLLLELSDSVAAYVVALVLFDEFVVVSESVEDRLFVVAFVSEVPLFDADWSPEFDVLLLVDVAASVLELPLVELLADPMPVVARALV